MRKTNLNLARLVGIVVATLLIACGCASEPRWPLPKSASPEAKAAAELDRETLLTKIKGTVFEYDPAMAADQCMAEPEYCNAATGKCGLRVCSRDYGLVEGRSREAVIARCKVEFNECIVRAGVSPIWHPVHASFGPDGRSLLVTVCRNKDDNQCTLRRYSLTDFRWEDLPGLEPGRMYGTANFDPEGKRIAVATWICRRQTTAPEVSSPKDVKTSPKEPLCNIAEPGLWLLDIQGNKQRELLGDVGTLVVNLDAQKNYRQVVPGTRILNPSFSPDGKHLAYWRMGGAIGKGGNSYGGWHVRDLDIASGAEHTVDAGSWWHILGGPHYIEGGRRIAFSAEPNPSPNNDSGTVFVVDLTGPLPASRPELLLRNDGLGDNFRLIGIRDTTPDGKAVITAWGGQGSSFGSLYWYDLRRGPDFFSTRMDGLIRKVWQEEGAGMINFGGAMSRDGRRMAIIKGMAIRDPSDWKWAQLWLVDQDGSRRHIRLDW